MNGNWFNMTAVVSLNRATVPTSNSVANTSGAYATGSPGGAAAGTINPPNTPGPDDDYRAYFPQAQVTWTDVALIYTDISNTNNGSQSPVLYAALGTASGTNSATFIRTDTNNGVYWTENPTSTSTIWYVGDPGGSPFSDPATAPTSVDARSSGEFPIGQFGIPSIPQLPVQRYGNIKIAAIAGATLASSTVYAAVSSPSGALFGIFKTSSGGQSWALVTTAPPNYMLNQGQYSNAIVAVNANNVYVGGYETNFNTNDGSIYHTVDGGTTWTDVTIDSKLNGPHIGDHAFTFVGGRLYVGTDGGLWSLNTANNTWSDLNGNMTISQINSVSANPTDVGTIFAGSQSNGIEEYNNDLAWTVVDGTNGGGQVFVDPQNPNNIYAVDLQIGSQATVRRSTDGGQTWTTILPTLSTTVPMVLDSLNPSRILVGGTTIPANLFPDLPSLVESLDGGNNWFDLAPPISVTALAISTYQGTFTADPGFALVTDKGANTYDPDTIYITDGTNVYVTKNNGVSWVNRTTDLAGQGTIYKLVVDPRNRDTVYAIFDDQFGDQVFMSTDAGQSWSDISYNLPLLPAFSLAIDPRNGDVYIGLDEGVYRLPNGTTTWEQFGSGMPNVQVRDLVLNQTTNTLLAGTYGRGVYQLFLNDGEANAGALQAVSGNSVWTGPILLVGAAGTNDVSIAANGTQELKNGIATASGQHRRLHQRSGRDQPGAPGQDRPGQCHPFRCQHLWRHHGSE